MGTGPGFLASQKAKIIKYGKLNDVQRKVWRCPATGLIIIDFSLFQVSPSSAHCTKTLWFLYVVSLCRVSDQTQGLALLGKHANTELSAQPTSAALVFLHSSVLHNISTANTSFFLVSSKYPGRPRAIGSPGCSPASCLCKLSSIHSSVFLFNSTAVYGSPVLILQQRQQSKDGLLWSVLSSHHVGPSD